ncbi:hypothetical protein Nepgr_016512 [Nepenthes gracilis]|uniref:Uncharacterized protein n=1 Tax=Nepenthes gracilis TaxID=150966 RepID=A0AAD3XSE3_NEPGR|nr:hypothetical protein Nepgr_016512 [Nepenthes gracilis]
MQSLDIVTASEEMSSTHVLASTKGCDVNMLCNCEETEDVYLKIMGKLHGKPENFTELSLGLELSELPVFWIARSSKNHSFHLPDGFEE